MRLGHFQCACSPGDFDANLGTVLRGLELAAEARLEVVSFPECFLNGYWADGDDARRVAFAVDSPEIREVCERTRSFDSTFMVGFNERRGDDLYNTVVVVERGEILGTYSKVWAYMPYHKQGTRTPVFRRGELTFGVIICADGGYIEPTRLLALKGAQVIFAPHYNYIRQDTLIDHYVVVRHDHVARAVENGVFFVRGNNFEHGRQGSLRADGVGYGDSYILDPNGQIMAAAGLHAEALVCADVDLARFYYAKTHRARSLQAAARFWEELGEVARGAGG